MAEENIIKLTEEQFNMAKDLTVLQRKLVLNIVQSSMTQRQAYLAAGGRAKTSNAQDAGAAEILANPKVKKFHESLIESAVQNAVMSRHEALERLTKTARVSITDICTFRDVEVGKDDNGDPVFQTVWTMKDSKDIRPEHAVCIKSVSTTKQGLKIELHDQNNSIKLMAEMQGWNSARKYEVTGKDGDPIKSEVDVSLPEIQNALNSIVEKL